MAVAFTVTKTQKVVITHHVKTTSIPQNAPLMHELEIEVSCEHVQIKTFVSTADVLEAILQNCPSGDFAKLVELAKRQVSENRE